MIAPAERPVTVSVHAVGLLGLTVIGWLPAALFSGAVLMHAVRTRNAVRVLQAGQAALFQVAALGGHVVLLGIVSLGFVAFGGDLPFLPEATYYIDPTSAGGIITMVLWALCVLALLAWYGLTLVLAVRAARCSATGVLYAYPVIGAVVWDAAPQHLPWLIVESSE